METPEEPRIADQWNLLAPDKKIKQYTYLQELAFTQFYQATTEKRRNEMEALHDFYGMKISELQDEISGKPSFWKRMFRRGA